MTEEERDLCDYLLDTCQDSDADDALDGLINAATLIVMHSAFNREHALAQVGKLADWMRERIDEEFDRVRAEQQQARQANEPMCAWEIQSIPCG
jgi:hypothetical protein